jgi:dimethylargininase
MAAVVQMRRFSRAIVQPPAPTFAAGLTTQALGAPDFARALVQHAAYTGALARAGLAITRGEANAAYPDGTFVEDTAVIVPGCAVLTRPGAPERAGEVDATRALLGEALPLVKELTAPATLDGGDVCEDGTTLFVGLSHRTNALGARQLAEIVAPLGIAVRTIDVRDVPGILHLKSGLVSLDDGRLVAIAALANHPEIAGRDVLVVAPGEEYAANCVRVNDVVLFAAGFPRTRDLLASRGYRVVELDMSEFQKMDGGLSCLSLRW